MYAVVDIETTGSHPAHDHIIEIAVYLHDGQKVTDQFCSLVNPNHPYHLSSPDSQELPIKWWLKHQNYMK
ncbi:MAG: hypothetical protein RL090_1214 [Bacteroidota bacterium]|jgi:DNA polymerase III epsilon subunit-like protein